MVVGSALLTGCSGVSGGNTEKQSKNDVSKESDIEIFESKIILQEEPEQREKPVEEGFWTRPRKVLALNLGGALGIAGLGAATWDYGSSSFNFKSEGWFEADSRYGGIDKLGHAWSSYALMNLYSNIYEYWDYPPDTAALYGALSSWGHTFLIEVGDGFSKNHGFSWEDLVADTVGICQGYVRRRIPYFRESVDFRLEWIPTKQVRKGERMDPFTDYSGQKYLLAFNPGGILKSDNPLLRALEFHLGYYTRGYMSGDERYFSRERRFGYIGIGLNVTYLLEQITGHKAANVFDYIQVPFTSMSWARPYD